MSARFYFKSDPNTVCEEMREWLSVNVTCGWEIRCGRVLLHCGPKSRDAVLTKIFWSEHLSTEPQKRPIIATRGSLQPIVQQKYLERQIQDWLINPTVVVPLVGK